MMVFVNVNDHGYPALWLNPRLVTAVTPAEVPNETCVWVAGGERLRALAKSDDVIQRLETAE